jgi:hypothetical protein
MAQIDSPYLAPGFGRARRVIRYDIPLSASVVADATNVGNGAAILIPTAANGFILRGLFISAGAAAGTAGGAKTVQISVGSAVNANTTLSGTDVDVMIASGAKSSAFVHGDAASDHVSAYFPIDGFAGGGVYNSTDLTIYLNYIAQSASATATPGTVTLQCVVWAFAEYLG